MKNSSLHISMCMLVRNEQSILKENILFHRNLGVKRFLIMDHLSTDDTAKIISELQKDIEIYYYKQDSPTYDQKNWSIALAKEAHRFNTDWIIMCDADEFWYPPDKKTFPEYFENHIMEMVYGYWHNNLPMFHIQPFYNNTYFQKTDWSKIAFRSHPNPILGMGNHNAVHVDSLCADQKLRIFHFQHRDIDNLFNKYINGAIALEKTDLPVGLGTHWRDGLDHFRKGKFHQFISGFYYTEEQLKAMPNVYMDTIIKDILEKI